MMPRILYLSAIVILIPISSFATVINVPGDCPTIQAAVDSCLNGDTVVVAPGFYSGDGNREITIIGKSITVMSSDGPLSTVIDCAVSYKGFVLDAGGSSVTELQGFTIQNVFYGVFCDSSSVILRNVIIENFVSHGIHFDGYLHDPPVTTVVEECIIRQVQPSYQGTGVALRGARSADISIYGSLISDCLYGLELHTLEYRTPHFDIQKCIIKDNLLDGIWTHS
jgi:hypothetical protein